MGRFINPFTDWGFKRIFGQEFSKALLIDFLNDLLEGERCITDVQYHDKEQIAVAADERCMIYDIYCTTDTGEHLIVEMQNKRHPHFLERTLCYASRCIIEQTQKGHLKKKKKDAADAELEKEGVPQPRAAYELLPVYTICFMNFFDRQLKKFRTDIVLADRDDHSVVIDKLRFIYLSLPYFNYKEEECTTNFDKWIYVLKHMEALERMPFTSQKNVFKVLEEYADSHALNQEEYARYQESLWRARDTYDYMHDYLTRGISIGREEGRKKGREEGREEGISEGKALAKRENALSLLKMGMTTDFVAQALGMTADEVRNLQKQE